MFLSFYYNFLEMIKTFNHFLKFLVFSVCIGCFGGVDLRSSLSTLSQRVWSV